MERPIVSKFILQSDIDTYLIRPTFGDSIQDCVSLATSASYRTNGVLTTKSTNLQNIASDLGKVIYLYRAETVSVIKVNEHKGVGYIIIHEDLDGNNTLVSERESTGKYITQFSVYSQIVSSMNKLTTS